MNVKLWVVRRTTVELEGPPVTVYLVKWSATGDRTYSNAFWTPLLEEACSFDLESARFAVSMVGGEVTRRSQARKAEERKEQRT